MICPNNKSCPAYVGLESLQCLCHAESDFCRQVHGCVNCKNEELCRRIQEKMVEKKEGDISKDNIVIYQSLTFRGIMNVLNYLHGFYCVKKMMIIEEFIIKLDENNICTLTAKIK